MLHLAPVCKDRSCMQQQYEEVEKRSSPENQKITRDFQRTAAAYSNLQAKFSRFQGAFRAKYRQVSMSSCT